MQRLSVENLRPGLVIARDIYNANGNILLRQGMVLHSKYIGRLRGVGIKSVYVIGPYDGCIEPPEAVREETRLRAITSLKRSFDKFRLSGFIDIKESRQTVKALVSEILRNRDAMIHLTDIRTFDDYTFGHCVNVCILSVYTAIALGYNEAKLRELALGALLHDIGKVVVPREILNKPGKLSEEEMEVVRFHAEEGFEILRRNPDVPLLAAHVAFQHQERINGTGYPRRLTGHGIHEYARIVAMADVYDALTSDRPYRRGILPHVACQMMVKAVGRDFDGDLLESFLARLAIYPVGTLVQLNTGEIAVVTAVSAQARLQPVIRVITVAGGQECTAADIDLSADLTRFIARVLDETEITALYDQLEATKTELTAAGTP